jgi:hypothetical protein
MTHVFVEEIPADIKQGALYVSMECATAIHRCACGCGTEVVTPFSPTDWSLLFDGNTVSLAPSIGNWNLPCRSHYFIERDVVCWAGDMSQAAIELGRARDRRNKDAYFAPAKVAPEIPVPVSPPRSAAGDKSPLTEAKERRGLWSSLQAWWSGRR